MAEINDLFPTDASNIARFPEGQAPSTVNNGARALEGILARGFRDSAVYPTKASGGAANAQTLTPNQTIATLGANMGFWWKAGFTNTGACTLNVADTAATGTKSVKLADGTDPYAGAITAGGYYGTVYNGTNHVLLNPSVGPAGGKALGADIVDDGTGKLTRSLVWVSQIASFSFVASDRGKRHRISVGGVTATLLPVATAGSGWNAEVEDIIGGNVIASPAADITVNGAAGVSSYTFAAGEWATIASNGSAYVINTNKPPASAIQGGFKNLKIATADGSVAPVITADQVTLENTGGNALRSASVNVTLALNATGAGKLDTGTIAAATWYYLWVIAKPDGTVSAIASLSSTSPTMPSGYTFKARVGAVRTKSGSAVLLGTVQYGRAVQYTSPPVPLMASGAAGNSTTPTWVAVAVANFVPPTASRIQGHVSTSGGIDGAVAPNNGYGASNAATNRSPTLTRLSGLAGGIMSVPFNFALESANIYWANNGATAELACMGWEDNL